MARLTTILLLCFLYHSAQSQIRISSNFSVDRDVTDIETFGDTTIVVGTFNNVGVYTGGMAKFDVNNDKPVQAAPRIEGEIYSSCSDGQGGFYIYGNFKKEGDVSSSIKIEHLLSNNTFESNASISIGALFYKDVKLKYHDSCLYIYGGSFNTGIDKVNGNVADKITVFDVKTYKIQRWMPKINGDVQDVHIHNNKLYIKGGFDSIGASPRKGIGVIERVTGNVTSWHPVFNGSFNDIEFYNGKIILGGGFRDSLFNDFKCILVDTINGNIEKYFVNNIYWAAGINKMICKGNVLYISTSGTYDTKITAIDLANQNNVLWAKYLNMIASVCDLEISGNSLLVAGSIGAIYKNGFDNGNDSNIERKNCNFFKLNLINGSLENWFPDPVGLIYSDVWTLSKSGTEICIGGKFSHVNGVTRSKILMIDGKTQEILPFKVEFGFWDEINALKIIDSTVYLAGEISSVNGLNYQASSIALNIKTGQVLSWSPPYLGHAYEIEANEKYVFLAGNLKENGGNNREKLFAIDRKTGALDGWNPDPDGDILDLHITNNKLYVSGKFFNISNKNRERLACYDLNTLNLTNWFVNSTYSNVTALNSTGNIIWAGGDFNEMVDSNVYRMTKGFVGIDDSTGMILHWAKDLNNMPLQISGVTNAIAVKGGYAFFGGTLSTNDPCQNILMYDISNRDLISFCANVPGVINGMAVNNSDLYFGGSFLATNNVYNANLNRVKFPSGYLNFTSKGAHNYYPKSGGNGGDVTINFNGDSIRYGMKFRLVANGTADIVAIDSNISFLGNNKMKVKLDLRGAKAGVYDIVLTDTNGNEKYIPKGFKIESFITPDIWTQVIGPENIRTGVATKFIIQVGNDGNCDAVGIPLFLIISGEAEIQFSKKFTTLKAEKLDSIEYVELDTIFGNPISAKGCWLLIPRINAGSTQNIIFTVKPLINNSNIEIKSIVNPPLFSSPMPSGKKDCYFSIANAVKDAVLSELFDGFKGDFLTCFDGVTKLFMTDLEDVYSGDFYNIDAINLGFNIASTAYSCGKVFLPQLRLIKILRYAFRVIDYTASPILNGVDVGRKCSDAADLNNNSNTKKPRTVNSFDPNDKIGIGNGSKKFITGNEQLSYQIRFENIDSATASAQKVIIIDTLDKKSFDLSTFKFEFVTLNDTIVSFERYSNDDSLFVDLRPKGINATVKVIASLDSSKGIVSWLFEGLDPLTLKPITDPLGGFLPPNKSAPEGEGSVFYSIKLKSNTHHNQKVSNKAYIYFDANSPIITPDWINTIDNIPPVSKVKSLPIFSDSSFTVNWNGTDTGCGVLNYSIFYSVNNQPYKMWLTNTRDTSAVFHGYYDSSYSFYSIAKDSALNKESEPQIEDAKTTISKSNSIQKADTPFSLSVYPNPAKDVLYVELNSSYYSDYIITIRSIMGQVLFQDKFKGTSFQVNTAQLNNGFYLFTIETSDKTHLKTEKIILQKP